MKGYKGFEKGLICRGKQYAENTVFEEANAEICKSGMHFCKNPFDVLDHYGFVGENGAFNEFAEVEALAETKTDDNKKFCTTKLKVGAKLSFNVFLKTCIDFILEKTITEMPKLKTDTKDESVMCSKTRNAKIGSSGYYAKIDSKGEHSVICCAGYNSIVKAKKSSWITLSEWEYDDVDNKWKPVCVKTEFVDGERIKEDTLYRLINGEFTEVEE